MDWFVHSACCQSKVVPEEERKKFKEAMETQCLLEK